MSVSTPSRSSRSGGKSAPRKKVKRAKSEIKAPRRRVAEPKELDLEEVRKRVLEALEHLGHQKFSTEPGGYDLKSWTKSLKTLLDDFEKKVGKDALSKGYHDKRKEVEKEFSKVPDSSKIDEEIDTVRKEESEIRSKMQEESERISARLSAIGADKVGRSKELEEEKEKLKGVQEERKSASFFSRLMGRGGPPTEPVETRIAELEKGLKMLEEEALNLQTVRKSLEGRSLSGGGLHDGLWDRVEALAAKLEELDDAKQVRLQLAKEREDAMSALRDLVSKVNVEKKPEE